MIKLELTLDKIDYNALIDALLPIMMDKLADSDDPKLRMAAKFPPAMASAALKSLPEEKKEEITVVLLDKYKWKLVSGLYGLTQQYGVSADITDVKVERA
ncbi:MAG: hypothetical protein ACI3YK_05485 [Eubacteriales bacterium]